MNEIYVSFFRDIPGFKELHSDDQLQLIRGIHCPELHKYIIASQYMQFGDF